MAVFVCVLCVPPPGPGNEFVLTSLGPGCIRPRLNNYRYFCRSFFRGCAQGLESCTVTEIAPATMGSQYWGKSIMAAIIMAIITVTNSDHIRRRLERSGSAWSHHRTMKNNAPKPAK